MGDYRYIDTYKGQGMRLVKCTNTGIIMTVGTASEIHHMVAMSKALSDSEYLSTYLDTDGVQIHSDSFSLRLFNSNTPYAGKWAREVYNETLAS